MVENHRLDEEAIDAILTARKEYQASLVHVDKWLQQGLLALEVCSLYEARQSFNDNFVADSKPSDCNINLITIVKLVRGFPEFDLAEPNNLADQILDIVYTLQPEFPFLKYPDTLLSLVIEAQKSLGCCSVGTAMDAVVRKNRFQRGEEMERGKFYEDDEPSDE